MAPKKVPGPKRSEPKPQQKPRTKEDAIQQLAEKDPQRAAAILREILKNK